MDWTKVLELAAGIVAGGLITIATSWFFAWRAEKSLHKRFETAVAAIEASTNTIPNKAADAVVSRNLLNAVLAVSPVLTRAVLKTIEKVQEPQSGQGPSDPASPGGGEGLRQPG